MAFQNFFIKAEKPNRETPAQLSGKELSFEFRVRNNGESMQVLEVNGYEDDNKQLHTEIIVTDPVTEETVATHHLISPK